MGGREGRRARGGGVAVGVKRLEVEAVEWVEEVGNALDDGMKCLGDDQMQFDRDHAMTRRSALDNE
jgi:hypothetical protein